MTRRIVCIKKDNGNHNNPHEAVNSYGWVDEGSSKETANVTNRQAFVDWVKQGNKAYVKDSSNNVAYCEIRTSSAGTEFLQTVADGKYTDNLLNLRECRI